MDGNSSPAAAEKTVLVTTRLDEASHRELMRIAAQADRTIAAEVRRAVRFYLESEEIAP